MSFRALTTLAILIVAATCAAATEFIHRNWRAEDGLPGTVVRSIVQSADGFLWVATAEGLARFDGIEFESIDLPPDIPWSRLGPGRLFATRNGAVWFSGHGGGLLRIHRGEISQVIADRDRPGAHRVTQVIDAPDGTLLARRSEEIWNLSTQPPTLIAKPPQALRDALESDLKVRACTGRILPDNFPALLTDRAGRQWRKDPANGITVQLPDPPGSATLIGTAIIGDPSAISEMLEDREGNVWISSGVNGLFRFRPRRATVLDASHGLLNSATVAVLEHPDGSLWIGNRSAGLDRWQDGTVTHHDFAPGSSGPKRAVSALHLDRNHQLRAAARDGSVFLWNGTAFEVAYPKQLEASRIDAIHQDGSGTLWFGGARGLFHDRNGTLIPLTRADGFPDAHISTLASDTTGHLLAATTDGRVFRYDGKRITALGQPEALAKRRVSAILATPDGIWTTTLGAGIHHWDGRRWTTISRDQGLPDPRITCILADAHGFFWFGSLGGIFRASRSDLIAHTRNRQSPVHWLRIDRSDGLPTRECSGSAHPSGWHCRDGSIRIPTANGLVTIQPAAITPSTTAPPIGIREVRANGADLTASNGIFTAGPGRMRLEISYRGIDPGSPEDLTYRTRLLPLDPAWRENGPRRETTYDTVPPGKYRFEVLAVQSDGVPSAAPATIDLVIRPFFWQTPWFITASVLAVIATATVTGWMAARARLKRRIQQIKLRHAQETERARIARDLHDDLGAKATELSLLASLATENPDPAHLAETLEEISSKSRQLAGSLDEIVWAVNPSEDKLRSLTEYLTASSREFLDRAHLALRLEIPPDPGEVPIASATRHAVFLAVREALNNVVKHAHARSVRLAITRRDSLLEIVIADDGQGLPEAHRHGNGLDNLATRMRECGGSCTLTSTPGQGTQVILSVPLGR